MDNSIKAILIFFGGFAIVYGYLYAIAPQAVVCGFSLFFGQHC